MALSGSATDWGNDRGDAVIAADPNAALLSDAEKDQIRAGFRLLAGVDVPHLVTNIEVATTVLRSTSTTPPSEGLQRSPSRPSPAARSSASR